MSGSLAIVIPTYNEAENIGPLLQALTELSLREMRIYVVDDNSPDGTADIVEALTLPQVTVIRRAQKLGIGAAYVHGFRDAIAGGAEYIIQMDADFSHAPSDVPLLYAAVHAGADLAIGSRRVRGGGIVGWGAGRKLMSFGAMTFARVLLGLKTKDVTAGFRCFRVSVLAPILRRHISSSGYAFQEEMLCLAERMGAHIVEIPVIFEDRQYGASKLSRKDIMEFFRTMIRLRYERD